MTFSSLAMPTASIEQIVGTYRAHAEQLGFTTVDYGVGSCAFAIEGRTPGSRLVLKYPLSPKWDELHRNDNSYFPTPLVSRAAHIRNDTAALRKIRGLKGSVNRVELLELNVASDPLLNYLYENTGMSSLPLLIRSEAVGRTMLARGTTHLGNRQYCTLRRLVEEIHAQGVASLDVQKRSNVVIGRDGMPRLFDFGKVEFREDVPPERFEYLKKEDFNDLKVVAGRAESFLRAG